MSTYQPVMEVAAAYHGIDARHAADLQRAFRGEMTIAEQVALARRIVDDTPPANMVWLLARLIVVAQDDTHTSPADTVAAAANVPASAKSMLRQVQDAINVLPTELRNDFSAAQSGDTETDVESIAVIARRITDRLAPAEMWRVLAGQMVVNAAGNRLLKTRFETMQPPTGRIARRSIRAEA